MDDNDESDVSRGGAGRTEGRTEAAIRLARVPVRWSEAILLVRVHDGAVTTGRRAGRSSDDERNDP